MGYIDKEIARQQKLIGAAVAGNGLQKAIKALQDKTRVRNSLEDPPARGSILAKRKLAKRSGGATSAGNFAEVSRQYYGTTQQITSSDGFFVISYSNLEQMVMQQGGLQNVIFSFEDYVPPTT